MTQIATYLGADEVRKLDELRGDIPRARVMSRAISKFIEDIQNGKQSLLPGSKVSNQAQTAAVSSFASSHYTTRGSSRIGV